MQQENEALYTVVCLCRTLRAERSANSKAKFSRRQRNCKSRELSALLVLALALLLISRNLPTPFYHLVSGLSCQVILDSCDKFAICAGPFQLTFKDTWIRHKDTHLPISLMPFLQIQKQYLQPIQQTLGGNGPSIFHFCICLLRKLEKFGWPPKEEEKRFFFEACLLFLSLGKELQQIPYFLSITVLDGQKNKWRESETAIFLLLSPTISLSFWPALRSPQAPKLHMHTRNRVQGHAWWWRPFCVVHVESSAAAAVDFAIMAPGLSSVFSGVSL